MILPVPVRVIASFTQWGSVTGYTVEACPFTGEPWLFYYRHVDVPDSCVNSRGEYSDRKATWAYGQGWRR